MSRVFAYITTYNRLELLKKVIAGVRSQTRKVDKLTVINNGSTDGTIAWLEDEGIAYITQANVGSSGGQWRAVSEGLDTDCDYIWIMDDDIVARPDCLENLMKEVNPNRIVAPLRWGADGKIFENEPISLNISNPFKSIWGKIVSEDYLMSKSFAPAEGLTFEGPLIPRGVAEKLGPPEFGFFIHADDTEYMLRAKRAGLELGLAPKARLDRMLPLPDINKEFTWKHYYVIRNVIALDVLHGNAMVRTLRPFFYLQAWLRRAKSKEDRATSWKAFKDGYNYQRTSREEIDKRLKG